MMKKLLLPVLLFLAANVSAQLNNSWIDYSKTYYKFKLGSDNVYRLPQSALASAGLGAANADHFQLWRNGSQVRLYTTVSGTPLGAADFIEFWGEMNDGKADTRLYRRAEFQLADRYSLETDTATYFLTVNSTGGNLRYTTAVNPPAGVMTPDASFMRTVEVMYNQRINRGYGKDLDEYVYSSSYDDGEGYSTNEIFTGQTFTETINNLNVYAAGPANSLSFKSNVYFNTDNSTRNLSVKLFNNEIYNDNSDNPVSVRIVRDNLPLSFLQNSASVPVSFTDTDPFPVTPPNQHPTDRMVIAMISLTYPATFNFNNSKAFSFELAPSVSGRYLLIDNFNYGSTAPVLYDNTTGARFVGDIVSTPGKVKFVVPPSASARNFRLVNQETANISTVAAVTQKTFVNYNTAATRGDYVIISNSRLFNDGSGNNYVEQYRAYRSTVNGGAFNAKIYDINELTDQFGYGIKKHPSAIRDFVLFMDQQYPVKPKFVFIIGRGMTYVDQRAFENAPQIDQLDFVTSFGWPASDNLLTATPGTSLPITPIGRLAAINGAEIGAYLQKVIQYETVQRTPSPIIADRAWMKNGMHVIGGKNQSESDLFRFYMDNYKDIFEDSLFGGKTETFVKTSVATIQQASTQRIGELFGEGLGFAGYFGHSSASSFEFNLSEPNNYNSTGKYPFFNVSGCSAGNFYTFDLTRLDGNRTLSEKYILTPQKGSIGFLADAHFGVPPTLDIYNSNFFISFARTLYGRHVGDQMKNTMNLIGGADPNLDYLPRIHLEEINLHGDPAIRINYFPKPDYAIEDQSIRITPTIISVADANFNVKVMLRNIGKATGDSIKVYVKRLLPNTTVPVTLYDQLIPATKNLDSLSLTVPINPTTDKGENKIIVELDYTNRVDEIYETNNKITKSFQIFEDELRPIYPYNYAIVNTQNARFTASTANPLVGTRNYVMEIDTTALFNSPIKKVYNQTGTGGAIQFTTSNLTFTDGTVYYWRTGVIPAAGNIIWNGLSFVYLANSTPGFNQSHYFQYEKNTYTDMVLSPDRRLRYGPRTSTLSVRTGIYPFAGLSSDYVLDNGGVLEQGGFYAPFSAAEDELLRFYIVDSITMRPWICLDNGTTGTYGSMRPLVLNSGTKPGFFHFDIRTPAARQVVVNFLDLIPAGNAILMTNAPGPNFTHFPAEWATDPGSNLFTKLTSMGFTTLNQLTTHKPFLFFTRKGSNTATVQIIGANNFDKLTQSMEVTGSSVDGSYTSDVMGPARKWNELHWRGTSLETPTADSSRVQVIGIDFNGTEAVLATVAPAKDTSLSWIDPILYPKLRLKMITSDSLKATPPQLTYWRINADLLPEGAIAPNIVYSMRDSVQEGEPINFSVAFKNISDVKFDSLVRVKFRITDGTNLTHDIPVPPRKALIAGDTLIVSYSIDTRGYGGLNTLFVEFNPDDHQPEQFHFNNLLYKNFFVNSDKLNPLLDVTFDGVHILNRDIVASRPNILVKLKDENRFLALGDTALMRVQIRYPDNSLHTFNFNGDTMRFIPADLAAGENTASIELKPYFPEDGEYELIVSGKDVSGNNAGEMNYHVSFSVINKPMISNLLNYPNPFTTSTAFVFTLTGSEIPQNMRIQILTITGKIVREVTQAELGPIRVGRNVTEFKWDGTDMYGQKLANGVYLYRVLTNLNGKKLDKFTGRNANNDVITEGLSETDKYFNKGYGKMYLMR